MKRFFCFYILMLGWSLASGYAQTEKKHLISVCEAEQYRFTPKVRNAFLSFAKARALIDLKAEGKTLPDGFLAWVSSHADVEAGVYGAHHKPADVLQHLFALRLDLGKEKFEKYHQLMLASAIVEAKLEKPADISPRPPLKLTIGGDPRVPVDTEEPGRTLDKNDHIINFLNDHTIEEEVVLGKKETELKYDDHGIAIPAPGKKEKKPEVKEKRTRTLFASDVIASEDLQRQFNAYMKERGHDVQITCGERVLHWNSCDMVRGQPYKDIHAAYMMFREAYEAKGLLPERRDPFPSPGEKCAFLIRNHEYTFPSELQAQRKWPRFPLTAPWSVLTMLAVNNQPLREREERWVAFRDTGEFKTYGEYIGGVAQQHPMQSARRLKPYPFSYSTIQMMMKDGGVCGTMAAISSRSHTTLGIPATQASQPGHCAMVAYRYDPESETYRCKGGQYATGGDDKTSPFTPWFAEPLANRINRKNGYEVSFRQRKPMVYHQSVAWAVNYGMASYQDSTLAHAVFQQLPEDDRKAHGLTLLESGLELNPYNFLLVDVAQAVIETPQEQIEFWKRFQARMGEVKDRPGCPNEGLYNQTVKKQVFARIKKLPVPKDKETVRQVYDFLEKEKCDLPEARVTYCLALEGLPALLTRTEQAFQEHLLEIQNRASRKNDTSAATMTGTIKAATTAIKDGSRRKEWAQSMWRLTKGQEKYFGHKYRLATHPAVPYLARAAGRKPPSEYELVQPVLERLTRELTQSVSSHRSQSSCRELAQKIQAAGNSLKDSDQKQQWLEGLSEILAGKETFKPAKKNAKPARDPCADTVQKLLQAA